jgi:glucose/arabinose dehydrogenase
MRRSIARLAIALLPIAAAFAASSEAAGQACSRSSGGITVPAGFCITEVADSLTQIRHFAVAANGDIYAAMGRGANAGLLLLRDTDRDGRYESRTRLYATGGNDVVLRPDGTVWFAANDAIVRIRMSRGTVAAVDTIVMGLPTGGHTTKSITFDRAGALYVDIGSRSNSCQQTERTERSPGIDPCPELDTRAGVWKFDAARAKQTQADGTRFATGLRNVVALTTHPVTGTLYGVQHGRDLLAGNWGFSNEVSAELPSEELVRIEQGSDYGWPYCYHDWQAKKRVLAPEYGGDGKEIGRCAGKGMPLAAFPGHWAPESIVFYTGSQFPAAYRDGAFISFHGSWNRAPLPQAGYRVVFQPFDANGPSGDWTTFVDGFQAASMRPMGLATGPDGSLYVGADAGGRIWRIRAQ